MKFEADVHLFEWFRHIDITEDRFQWDQGNKTKNFIKHKVTKEEVTEIFQSEFVLGGRIVEPFHPENRWILFGETIEERLLTLIFTIRDDLIRPISARPMRKKERKIYEETLER